MEPIKVIIVDDNAELRNMVTKYLGQQPDVVVVGQAANGEEALYLLAEKNPDVMLLDIIMPKMDGYTLLEQMGHINLPQLPHVIALTALGRDDFISRAIELGVSYYMVKPFDFAVLYQRVLELAGRGQAKPDVPQNIGLPATPHSLDERIAGLFLTIGIPAHIKGYQFLREAVKMVMEHPEMINRITKELYPGVARRFDTTSSKVERAIRHAIEVAWNRGRIEVMNQIFGPNVCSLNDKPSNGEFVALMADKLTLERSA
ncbi:MAG: sporulation transcription factor Spo0A [Oscillospiraceae bacterium]|jgi:two-component system response regulator (stage 0 sporulation protein A)|nr:sporulation transcription factor Spo0A [Oscillospiraceae bacterium]